jgi:hypothetical protein
MKKVVVLLVMVLAFNLSNAQELSVNKVDEFNGKTVKITKYYIAGTDYGEIKTSFVNIINPEKKTSYNYIKIYSTVEDFGCAGSNKNYLILLFDDGTKIKLDNDISDISCKDYSESTFVLQDDVVDAIKNKTVKKIRFAQSEGYADYTVSGTYTLSQQISALWK